MRIYFSVVVFVGALMLTTIACTVAWERVIKDRIYNCTDDLPFDYLQPGSWVHNPVIVPNITVGRSMSEPDTIMQGWSVADLWALWLVLVFGSLVISFLIARLAWTGRIRRNQVYEQANAA